MDDLAIHPTEQEPAYHHKKKEEQAMTTREELLEKLRQRKANRDKEIEGIPLPGLRKRYQQKLGSDETMREFFGEVDDLMLKYWNHPVGRTLLGGVFSFIQPWVFKKQFQHDKEPKGFLDSVADYCMYATSYGAWPIEIAEVTENRVVGYFDVCPAKCENQLKLCRVVTSLEPRLSKKDFFGTTVTYTERMPEGAERCKVVFDKK